MQVPGMGDGRDGGAVSTILVGGGALVLTLVERLLGRVDRFGKLDLTARAPTAGNDAAGNPTRGPDATRAAGGRRRRAQARAQYRRQSS